MFILSIFFQIQNSLPEFTYGMILCSEIILHTVSFGCPQLKKQRTT